MYILRQFSATPFRLRHLPSAESQADLSKKNRPHSLWAPCKAPDSNEIGPRGALQGAQRFLLFYTLLYYYRHNGKIPFDYHPIEKKDSLDNNQLRKK